MWTKKQQDDTLLIYENLPYHLVVKAAIEKSFVALYRDRMLVAHIPHSRFTMMDLPPLTCSISEFNDNHLKLIQAWANLACDCV